MRTKRIMILTLPNLLQSNLERTHFNHAIHEQIRKRNRYLKNNQDKLVEAHEIFVSDTENKSISNPKQKIEINPSAKIE